MGAPRAPWGPMGPMGPMVCVSRGVRDPPGMLFPAKMLLRQETRIFTLDLAKGGAGDTQDPMYPLPRNFL